MLGLDLNLDMELNQLDPRLEDRELGRAMGKDGSGITTSFVH